MRVRPGSRRVMRLMGAVVEPPEPDEDALALAADMEPEPDAARLRILSRTTVALKDAGIWAGVDELWFPAAHSAQAGLLGWKRYRDALAVDAPAFEANWGFTGNGSSSYINLNYIPDTHGVQWEQENASFGFWTPTAAQSSGMDMGRQDGSATQRDALRARTTSDLVTAQINESSMANVSAARTNGAGLTVARRVDPGSRQVWVNGAQAGINSDLSAAPGENEIYLGAWNNAGTAGLFTTRQYAFAFVGGGLTAGQQASLYAIVANYLAMVGAA